MRCGPIIDGELIIGFTQDGDAIIDTTDLFRMRIVGTDKIVSEFCTAEDAQDCIEIWDQCGGGKRVEPVPYKPPVPSAG